MRERGNAVLTALLAVSILWVTVSWLFAPTMPIRHIPPSLALHQYASPVALAMFGGLLFYAVKIKDRLPDKLAGVCLGGYFEQDGLCFVPLARVTRGTGEPQAEISLYYQNRYAGPCEAVIHLRPPPGVLHSHR